MINDNFALTGALTIAVNDEVVQETDNLVVTTGRQWVAGRMKGTTSEMTHMAIGTTGTAAIPGDDKLLAELERNTLTTSGGLVTSNTIKYECTFPAGDGTGAIKEAGLFEAGGDKLDDINVTNGGTGYTSAPTVTVAGNGTATAAITGDKVTSVTITSSVANNAYSTAPAVSFSGGGGSGAAATATLKEGGVMLARTDFLVVNKGADDSMTITWTITVS